MGEVAQEAHKGQVLDQAREQRIEIATRLMVAWLRNNPAETLDDIEHSAKLFAKAALTIQREA